MKERGRTKSKLYKGVYWIKVNGKQIKWYAQISINGRHIKSLTFHSEREAALRYDKIRIRNGKNPVNILKKQIK